MNNMTKPFWEIWSANVHLLLITKYNFTKEKAEDLLYGQWTDCTYDMWKEDYSYEDAIKTITDPEQPWNKKNIKTFDENIENDVAEYIDKWRDSHSMTTHRIARHIIQMINKNTKKLTDEQILKLAEIYGTNMNTRVCVAQICDEVLDKSGGLLGEIREIYRKNL